MSDHVTDRIRPTQRSLSEPTQGQLSERMLRRELARMSEELETARAERVQLMIRLVSAQEAERERIAADIHDDSLQAMASAVLRLGMLARELTDDSQQDAVYRVSLSIEAAIARMRRLVFELSPPGLATSSLGDALRAYVSDFAG